MRHRIARVGLAVFLAGGLILAPGTPASADSVRDSEWPLRFLNIAEAQKITQGEGITVAVLDTGIDATQPDLTGSILAGYDDWSPAKDGRTDPQGHGTGIAALIAGHGHGANGADGILGVAPMAKILPYTIYRPNDTKHSFAAALTGQGIRWAVDHGAQVICIASAGDADIKDDVNYALGKGIPVVAGADNLPGVNPGFPATYPGVISVSSVDETGKFAATVSTSGYGIRFSAPGVNIPVTKLGGGYATTSGNSLATALTAGVVALIRAKYPTLSGDAVFERLKATVTDGGTPGLDDQYGYGTINPVAALTQQNTNPSASAPTTNVAAKPNATTSAPTYTTAQLVVGYSLLAGCVLVVGAIGVTTVVLIRRRRRRLSG
jgi:subtilisin family serine protease